MPPRPQPGQPMVRAATAFLRLGPVHERFLRLKFTSPAPLNRTPTSLAPIIPSPRATGRRRRRRHERIRSYGWRRQRRGSLASQLQGMRRGGGSDYAGSDVGDAPPPSSAVPAATPAACAGTRARPPRPPVSPSVRRGRPTGSPRSPRGTGTRRPLQLRPRIRARTSPVRRRQQTLRGLPSAAAALAAPPAGTTSTGAFPTPRRAPQRRPHGRSTRRRSPGGTVVSPFDDKGLVAAVQREEKSDDFWTMNHMKLLYLISKYSLRADGA